MTKSELIEMISEFETEVLDKTSPRQEVIVENEDEE